MPSPIVKLFSLLLCVVTLELSAQTNQRFRIVSYNLENLFDTINDPKVNDDDFTPSGKFAWTKERYQTKINNLSKVINAMCDTITPLMIGVCEAENKAVLKDWVNNSNMKQHKLGFVHFDSVDPRGIDVALLYNKKFFKPVTKELIPLSFDFDERYKPRGILYVKGVFNKATLHVFINHWSSRKGGASNSEIRRLRSGTLLRVRINEILATDKNARIVVLGDFNDTPLNPSVADSLNAKQNLLTLKNGDLFNLMSEMAQKGKYSFNFEGEQDMLDQILVTQNFVSDSCSICIERKRGEVFQPKWLMYKSDKFGQMPNRTFSGFKYVGGYSDHLPVYADVLVK